MTILSMCSSAGSLPMDQNGLVDAARHVDSLEKLVGLCSIFRSLPCLHKKLLHVLFGSLLKDNSDVVATDEGYEDELVKPPIARLLSLLCELESMPSRSSAAFKDALDEATHHAASSVPSRMQLQQLLSLATLHPAFSATERADFSECAANLVAEDHGRRDGHAPLVITDSNDLPSSPTTSTSTPGSVSPLTPNSLSPQNSLHPDGYSSGLTVRQHASLHATYSAPPAQSRETLPVMGAGAWGPKLSLTDAVAREKVHRSLSSSPSAGENDGPSISDSNCSLSNLPGDETYVHIAPKPGMRDVPLWLKGLRLHKYCSLLAGRTYEELLGVGEAQLEAWNVTKGARHKIAMCIEKLRQRPDDLCKLAKQLNDVTDVRVVLQELRSHLATPIKMAPTFCMHIGKVQHVEDVPPEDLAARIVVVFRKAANIYLSAMAQQTIEDDCSTLFIQMADRCSRHDAFYGSLKSTILSIKQSIQTSLRSTGFIGGQRKLAKSYSTVPGHSFGSQTMYAKAGPLSGPTPTFFLSPPDTFPNRAAPQHRMLHRTQAIGKSGPVQSAVDLDRLLKPKTSLCRAKSAPVPQKPLSATESNMWFDLDPDLETLTLSVTEHALDSFENV